jgi:DNA-binding NtrC family response regulator
MSKEQIIVIDDDISIRNVIKIAFKKEYDVLAVESVESALFEIMQGFSPKVAIVDYFLPGASGGEFIEAMSSADCAHIMITARNTDADFISDMMKKGAMYILHKPFSIIELKAMVRKALEGRNHGNSTSD